MPGIPWSYITPTSAGHNNPRFAIISGRVSFSGGRGARQSEGDGVGEFGVWAGGGVRAAYNKHFMHGVRARGP